MRTTSSSHRNSHKTLTWSVLWYSNASPRTKRLYVFSRIFAMMNHDKTLCFAPNEISIAMHVSIEFKLQPQPSQDRVEHPLLSILNAVHQAGSIRLAAKKLDKSYRHVWGHLKSWEQELGVDLIVWGVTCKGVTLTPQAQRFLQEQEKIQGRYERDISRMKHDLKACMAQLIQH